MDQVRSPKSFQSGLDLDKAPSTDQDTEDGGLPDGPQKPNESLQDLWEIAFQEFLEDNELEEELRGELTPWADTRAFLASFEQVAVACRWPRKEWVTRLLPSLTEDAEKVFISLDAQDRGDFRKVKAAILRQEAADQERKRQDFRRFGYQEAKGPREACARVQELGHQWLKVEKTSKEQIVEMLFLEQFLDVLPKEMRKWVQEHGPENCTHAASLAEEFLRRLQTPEREKGRESEEMGSSSAKRQEAQVEMLKTQTNSRRENWEPSSSQRTYPGYAQASTSKEELLQWGHYREMKLQARFPGRANTVLPYPWKPREGVPERRRSERLRKIHPLEPRFKKRLSQDVPKSQIKICLWCGKTLNGLASYIRHEMMHTGRKRFKCGFCFKGFCWRSELTRHEFIHTGKKPHECAFCGEGFDRKWKRDRHQLMHMQGGGRL
ncbi:zinc finger protein 396-like [Elgaria multicarinata webbii]|uniref:zinc finger protein 396-like n=1 Tax=Elgaria multicarinata webbii TaxID=159646 RepID=UPI002FCD67EB